MTTTNHQLAFDLDAMMAELDRQDAPAWEGAPLSFTMDYYSPDELHEAFQRFIFEQGQFDCIRVSHMWHNSVTLGHANQNTQGHDLYVVSADLRCHHYTRGCSCVGNLLYRGICVECNWSHTGDERDVVEAWHDHAWAGWRDLPRVPVKTRNGKGNGSIARWVEENYPADWQKPGAPILTERENGGTRHVPQRSPWRGFDLAAARPADNGTITA